MLVVGTPFKDNRLNNISLRAFLTRRVSLTDGIVQLYAKRILAPACAFKVIALSSGGYVDGSGNLLLLSGSGNLFGSGRLDGWLFVVVVSFVVVVRLAVVDSAVVTVVAELEKVVDEEVLGSERPPELLSLNSPQAVSKSKADVKRAAKILFNLIPSTRY